jgi:SAM-dependent methyltransferase
MSLKQTLSRYKVNSSRVYLEAFLREAASRIPAGAMLLDAGAGDGRYKPLFAHTHYESADFAAVENFQYGELTYVCDLTQVSVEDARYDAVICTQVLEHVPDPVLVLKEMNRILKMDGLLFLTTPLFFEEHMHPYDFYRYTQHGLRHLATRCGFHPESIAPLEGFSGTVSYQLEYAALNLPLAPSAYGGGIAGAAGTLAALFSKPAFLGLSWLFARLDVRHKHTAVDLCKNHSLIARKVSENKKEEA